jgi:hypothetical protein
MKRGLLIAAGVIGLVFTLSACDPTDSGSQPWNDAPIDKSKFNNGVADGSAFIVNMPDGFSNLAVKCINGAAIITTYHGTSSYAAITVAEGSALCK